MNLCSIWLEHSRSTRKQRIVLYSCHCQMLRAHIKIRLLKSSQVFIKNLNYPASTYNMYVIHNGWIVIPFLWQDLQSNTVQWVNYTIITLWTVWHPSQLQRVLQCNRGQVQAAEENTFINNHGNINRCMQSSAYISMSTERFTIQLC